jgi:hypothetical protein
MLSSTVPSEWARNLVRGAYDLHVHVAPDVMRRRVTDVQLARRCWDAGLAGFVLKSHYVPTAERAAVVNEALGGEVQVLGALALNASVGGMNPLAVEIAAREGARILWMPTVDAANHRAFGRDFAPDAQPPPPWRPGSAMSSPPILISRSRTWASTTSSPWPSRGFSWNAVSARRTRACATGPAWSPTSGPPGPRRRS